MLQPRWEYKIVKNMLADSLEASLNRLGAEGWEVVSLAGIDSAWTLTGNKLYAVMKRPSFAASFVDDDQDGIPDAIEILARDPRICVCADEFQVNPTPAEFERLCRLTNDVVESWGIHGQLLSLPQAARSALLQAGESGHWSEAAVRSVVELLVRGPDDYVARRGLLSDVASDWRTDYAFLGDEFSQQTLDSAWIVASQSLPTRPTPALRELCKRIDLGAPPEAAWANICE
jgi:hypothetical protein